MLPAESKTSRHSTGGERGGRLSRPASGQPPSLFRQMATAATPPRSGFSALLPAEPAPIEAPPSAADTAPDWNPDDSTIESMSRPFRNGEDTTSEKAVEHAIEMVVLERLKALFPSTMNQQTEVMAPMIAEEVFTWACPEAGDFETQCTPDSPARSGYRKLPILHTPTTDAERLETYKTATDVHIRCLRPVPHQIPTWGHLLVHTCEFPAVCRVRRYG